MTDNTFNPDDKNVPVQKKDNVPVTELVQVGCCQKQITKETIELLATEKYRSNGKGITIEDLITKFSVNKPNGQRSLKYFHSIGVVFTAQDLILKGINLLQNKNPQEYFPTCIKADIIENLKRNSVLVQPSGVHLSKDSLFPSANPLSNALEHQKAQSFLEVLVLLPFTPSYLHKLQLMFHLDKEYYNELKQNEQPINRAKPYEEIIGRRHVVYRLCPNGTVEVSIRTTDTPFRMERDEDVSELFSFLGQVRDRFLYHVSDIRERHVPPLLNWILKQCDLNKDIILSDKAQIILPDIQLKQADRVFRLYVKILDGKAYYRGEESLTLNQILQEALDSIRHPYKSIENIISEQYIAFIELLTDIRYRLDKLESRSDINCT